jgi:hypothetical protein
LALARRGCGGQRRKRRRRMKEQGHHCECGESEHEQSGQGVVEVMEGKA